MKKVVVALFVFFVLAQIFVLIAFQKQRSLIGSLLSQFFHPPSAIQGLGDVALSVLGKFVITLYSPQPITYNNQSIDLNVSANTDIALWQFTLQRLSGNCLGEIVYDKVGFVPNITFFAVRGNNSLTVFAQAVSGESENVSVLFTVNVSNQAPFVLINQSYFACERSEFSVFFEVADENLDCLDVSLNQSGPFYVFIQNRFLNLTTVELFSARLEKSDVGVHWLEVIGSDGEHADTKIVNVSVLPVNNPPVIMPIPFTTLETFNSTNSTFFYPVSAFDIEDGDSSGGNLKFNSTFLLGRELFIINKTSGLVNFTYNVSDIGSYRAHICVEDRGFVPPAESVVRCNET